MSPRSPLPTTLRSAVTPAPAPAGVTTPSTLSVSAIPLAAIHACTWPGAAALAAGSRSMITFASSTPALVMRRFVAGVTASSAICTSTPFQVRRPSSNFGSGEAVAVATGAGDAGAGDAGAGAEPGAGAFATTGAVVAL